VNTPLLGLVMIVKDEVHRIRATLESVRDHIDCWTILDTGSTDGTQEIVREVLGGVPGSLHEEPFADFSTSRNRALDLHGAASEFVLFLDGDDVLRGGGELRAFLEQHRRLEDMFHEAYLVNIRRPHLGQDLSYHLPVVLRVSGGWRYRYPVHECSGRPGGVGADQLQRIPAVSIRQERPPESQEASRARWKRDLKLLQACINADPENQDPRVVFYLAQTYECLGRWEAAASCYAERIAAQGPACWPEETYTAMIGRARSLDALGYWSEAQEQYLQAHALDPHRAEPLFKIAWYYYEKDRPELTYLFARRAMELPEPVRTLYVERDVYEWRAAELVMLSAYHLAEKLGDESVRAIGRRAADQVVRARPQDEHVRKNRAYYTQPASELFDGYRNHEIQWKPEAPFTAMNPSIWFDGKRWRCVIRTVNYRIQNDVEYPTPGGVPIQTRNWMAELDWDLSIERVVEMQDLTGDARSDFPVHGFEDCRLFSCNKQLYCTSTACDLNESGAREIVRLTLDENYQIIKARPIRGSWSNQHQKNWMPMVVWGGLGEAVRFVYAVTPEVVILDLDRQREVPADSGRLRGGSQLVNVPTGPSTWGWLCLVHDVTWEGRKRTYVHRFVLLEETSSAGMPGPLRVAKVSPPFYFKQRGIEFCAGLGFDGRRLVASFSVNDESAHLAEFDLESVLATMQEDFVP
jgi:tetratricopeptide (TPR) repeat protein